MANILDKFALWTRKGTDIASAATITVPVRGDRFDVTGTTGITTINTNGRGLGQTFRLRFADVVTLTHDEANLILADGANLDTEAGQLLEFEVIGTNQVRQVAIGGAASEGAGFISSRLISLRFLNAPPDQIFAILVGDATDPVLFNGNVNAATLQAALAACDDLAGYTVSVKGSTTAGAAGLDGTTPYTGRFYILLDGPSPYPEILAEGAEVQQWQVTDGDADADYKPHTGATARALGSNAAQRQADLRAVGGNFALVVMKGSEAAPVTVAYVVEDAGEADANGIYLSSTVVNGYTSFVNSNGYKLVYNLGEYWELRNASNTVLYHSGMGITSTPHGWDWQQDAGALPVPTLYKQNNLAHGGTAIASSQYSGSAPRAFDSNVSNNQGEWSTTVGALPAYIGYDLGDGNAAIVRLYRIYCASANDRNPYSWTFEGSNTGAWSGEEVVLHTVTDNLLSVGDNVPNEFSFANETAYRYYRLNITEMSGPSTAGFGPTVGELEMYTTSATSSGDAYYRIYFPYTVGDVATITPEGTGSVGLEVATGAAPSGAVFTEGATLEELLYNALE